MTALLVMPGDLPATAQLLRSSGLKLLKVSSCQEAREVLESGQTVHLVVTHVNLPDGSWCTVANDLIRRGAVAEVVVCTRRREKVLWYDVVWRGGYCALVESHEEHPLRAALQSAFSKAAEGSSNIRTPRSKPRQASFTTNSYRQGRAS